MQCLARSFRPNEHSLARANNSQHTPSLPDWISNQSLTSLCSLLYFQRIIRTPWCCRKRTTTTAAGFCQWPRRRHRRRTFAVRTDTSGATAHCIASSSGGTVTEWPIAMMGPMSGIAVSLLVVHKFPNSPVSKMKLKSANCRVSANNDANHHIFPLLLLTLHRWRSWVVLLGSLLP